MADLKTTYLGLELKNPIIAGSSGLTDNIASIIEIERSGAAAVVLKSIFEEEITLEYESLLNEADNLGYGAENMDYFDYQIRENNLKNYLNLIKESKSQVEIPIIASINCISTHEWEHFAKQCEDAGADAIELNVFILPSELSLSADDIHNIYLNIITKVKSKVNIPIALKISPYFTNLGAAIKEFSETELDGLVLFNRYFSPDFDIEKLEITSSFVFSNPEDLALTMRWIAIMSRKVSCDLSASTGVHNGESVIKQLLAGATTVQLVSALYKNGTSIITVMLKELNEWMDSKGFNNLNHFRGLMSQVASADSAAYERVQFMKFFSGKF